MRALPFDEHGNLLRFEGYSPKAFDFLRKLKRNNRRDWFQPRKTEYESLLVVPTKAMVAELGARLSNKTPGVKYDTRRAVFRIYRDVRFSNDKSPYKTYTAAHVSFPSKEGASSRPGYYFHVEPGEAFIGGGLWMPSPEQLKRIRRRIDENPQEFKKIISAPALKKHFGALRGKHLSRAPKGWPPDHPSIELLKLKQFFVGKEFPESAATRKDFPDVVARHFKAVFPLLQWLDQAVR